MEATEQTSVAVVTNEPSIIATTAAAYGMGAEAFERTLMQTVMPQNTKKAEVAAFLMVAKQYNLNPFTKEIYAFPAKGGIQPVVSIDGWLKLINEHPECDGVELVDQHDDKGNITAVTCKIHRKDRNHPTTVTEYMAECVRSTEPWKKWPARMLRHKAMIQGARYAFGFAGIVDQDEAERIGGKPKAPAIEAPQLTEEQALWRDEAIRALEDCENVEALEEMWAATSVADRRLIGPAEFQRIKEEVSHD